MSVFLMPAQHLRGVSESQVDEVSNWRAARSGLKGTEKAPFGHVSQTRQTDENDSDEILTQGK